MSVDHVHITPIPAFRIEAGNRRSFSCSQISFSTLRFPKASIPRLTSSVSLPVPSDPSNFSAIFLSTHARKPKSISPLPLVITPKLPLLYAPSHSSSDVGPSKRNPHPRFPHPKPPAVQSQHILPLHCRKASESPSTRYLLIPPSNRVRQQPYQVSRRHTEGCFKDLCTSRVSFVVVQITECPHKYPWPVHPADHPADHPAVLDVNTETRG